MKIIDCESSLGNQISQSIKMNTPDLLQPGHIVKERWKVVKKIGNGGFGEIYESVDLATGRSAALKVESTQSQKQVLRMEVAVIKALQNTRHVCLFLGCGRNLRFNYLAMQLLGSNLADLKRNLPNGRFSISTTIRVSQQILIAIQSLHQAGFLHRDIKPSNFALGCVAGCKRNVYMIDFGLARQYRMPSGEIRSPRDVAGFRGTVRYASLNAHKNKELGRHDDLWSFYYMIAEFIYGDLPWKKFKDRKKVESMKENFDHLQLARQFPSEFSKFYSQLCQLEYPDEPNYVELRKMFYSCMVTRGCDPIDPFDWEIIEDGGELQIDEPSVHHCTICITSDDTEPPSIEEFADSKAHAIKNKIKGNKHKTMQNSFVDKISPDKNFHHNESDVLCNDVPALHDKDYISHQIAKLDSKLPASNSTNRVPSTTCDNNGHIQPPELDVVKQGPKDCRVSNLDVPPKLKSKDMTVTQFAIADDNVSAMQQMTKGGGPALTLVSKWQSSFDDSVDIDPELENIYLSMQDNVKMEGLVVPNNKNYNLTISKDEAAGLISLKKKSGMVSGIEHKVLEMRGKRRRPVCRSMSQPAKTPPKLTVRGIITEEYDKPRVLHIGNVPITSETQGGLPRCWSCPTISLLIRSHLKPPLKQQASFDENVYEVDIMRNVAAKQQANLDSAPPTDERRTSLPHISVSDIQSKDTSHEVKTESKIANITVSNNLSDRVINVPKEGICAENSCDGNIALTKSIKTTEKYHKRILKKNASEKSIPLLNSGKIELQRSLSGPYDRWQGKDFPGDQDKFIRNSRKVNQNQYCRVHNLKFVEPESCIDLTKINKCHVPDKKKDLINDNLLKDYVISSNLIKSDHESNLKINETNNVTSINAKRDVSLKTEKVTPVPDNYLENNNWICQPRNSSYRLEKSFSYKDVNSYNYEIQHDELLVNAVSKERNTSICAKRDLSDMDSKNLISEKVCCDNIVFDDSHSRIPVRLRHLKTVYAQTNSVSHEKGVPSEEKVALRKHLNTTEKRRPRSMVVCQNDKYDVSTSEEKSHFSGINFSVAGVDSSCARTALQNSNEEHNDFENSLLNCSKNHDKNPVRRRRANPECKYVKDESDLKLNFVRKKHHRPVPVTNASRIPRPYNNKQLSDPSNSSYDDTNDTLHSSCHKDSAAIEISDKISLQRVSSAPTVPLLGDKQLYLCFQGQNISRVGIHALPEPPPGEPPPNYCLPSRFVPAS